MFQHFWCWNNCKLQILNYKCGTFAPQKSHTCVPTVRLLPPVRTTLAPQKWHFWGWEVRQNPHRWLILSGKATQKSNSDLQNERKLLQKLVAFPPVMRRGVSRLSCTFRESVSLIIPWWGLPHLDAAKRAPAKKSG